MNKKLKTFISSSLAVVVLLGSSLSFAKPIGIYHMNEKVELDRSPIHHNGRVLAPIRALDVMHFDYDWHSDTQTVIASYDAFRVELKIGSKYAKITEWDWDIMDEVTVVKELDTPPVIDNGNVFVPIRFIGEVLGMRVSWDQRTQNVFIDAYPESLLDEIYFER